MFKFFYTQCVLTVDDFILNTLETLQVFDELYVTIGLFLS